MNKQTLAEKNRLKKLLYDNRFKFGGIALGDVFIKHIHTRFTISDISRGLDFMTFTVANEGEFSCFKVAGSVHDMLAMDSLTFLGHYNYFVMTEAVYKEVRYKDEFVEKLKNGKVGVVVEDENGKLFIAEKPKRQKVSKYVKQSLFVNMLESAEKPATDKWLATLNAQEEADNGGKTDDAKVGD